MEPHKETKKKRVIFDNTVGIGHPKKSRNPEIKKPFVRKEEVPERTNHLLASSHATDQQNYWRVKALDHCCSECNQKEYFVVTGRAFVVDTKAVEGGTLLKNCSYCLVRNVSWLLSFTKLTEEERALHFNRISTPQTQFGAELLVKAMENYEKNRFIVVVISSSDCI